MNNDQVEENTTSGESHGCDTVERLGASVIVNADDWGRDVATTDRSLDCVIRGVVSSASAMVFMEDSERAAHLARQHSVDAGLHLNFTMPFSARQCPLRLKEQQERISRFLRSNRFSPVIYHPGLAASFEYVVKAQQEEYEQLYGAPARRMDGHHHMHLCANIVYQNLLPRGTIVRRNFSLWPGEKIWFNRLYRRWQDRWLSRRYRLADFFFDLYPLDPRSRLERIFQLGTRFNVEVETHPINNEEYRFLIDGELMRCAGNVEVARGYLLRFSNHGASVGEIMTSSGIGVNTNKVMDDNDPIDSASEQAAAHISVCVCTYKRPLPLKRLLFELSLQETEKLFTYSIVVADNDEEKSAEATVAEFRLSSAIPVKYVIEPKRSIARARNKVVNSAGGEYSAFIDDDEYPTPKWLLTLFKTCNDYKVDGVLGPVLRSFDEVPPAWLKKSRFYIRRVNPTGMRVDWREARTGNVLINRRIIARDTSPFRPEFRVGEDQEFFKRKVEEGCIFIWCAEAEVFEVVPPARWKRNYLVRRALLGGAMDTKLSTFGIFNVVKAVLAVPLYCLLLPFTLLLGQHRFMGLLVRLCYHIGRLLELLGIEVVREEYVTD